MGLNNFWVCFQHILWFYIWGAFFSTMRVKGQKCFHTVHQCQGHLPTICPWACQLWPLTGCPALPSSNWPEASYLQPSPAPGGLFPRAPVLTLLTLCQMPFCLPPHAPGNFLVTLSDHSKETSVLLKHLFTPRKTYHSNVIASLFVILPIVLQISRGKDLGFSFPAASDTAAKHGSQSVISG